MNKFKTEIQMQFVTNSGCYPMDQTQADLMKPNKSRLEVVSSKVSNNLETKFDLNSLLKSNDSQKNLRQKNQDSCGDVEIVIWNKNKTKKLISFRSEAMQTLFNNKENMLSDNHVLKSFFQREKVDEPKIEVGRVTLKIFEDQLGKRDYKMIVDTKQSSTIQNSGNRGNDMLKWTGGKGKSRFLMGFNEIQPAGLFLKNNNKIRRKKYNWQNNFIASKMHSDRAQRLNSIGNFNFENNID